MKKYLLLFFAFTLMSAFQVSAKNSQYAELKPISQNGDTTVYLLSEDQSQNDSATIYVSTVAGVYSAPLGFLDSEKPVLIMFEEYGKDQKGGFNMSRIKNEGGDLITLVCTPDSFKLGDKRCGDIRKAAITWDSSEPAF